jgi:hypothetical protein
MEGNRLENTAYEDQVSRRDQQFQKSQGRVSADFALNRCGFGECTTDRREI